VLSLAREVDPEGQRTVGVLTKPDTIEEACHAPWLAVLKGERYPLRLGYFLVRSPSQAQLLQVGRPAPTPNPGSTAPPRVSPWLTCRPAKALSAPADLPRPPPAPGRHV
jgi:hypothetical protein